jgi:hypothetical protein
MNRPRPRTSSFIKLAALFAVACQGDDSGEDTASTTTSTSTTAPTPTTTGETTGETTTTTTTSTTTTATTATTATTTSDSETDPTSATTADTDSDGTDSEGELPDGAEFCNFDVDLPYASSWTDDSVIRLTPDGERLYLAASGEEIYGYIKQPGSACAFKLDPQFGDAGVLDTSVYNHAADNEGRVYINRYYNLHRVWPAPEVNCETYDANVLAVDPTNTHRVAISSRDPRMPNIPQQVYRFDLSGDPCVQTPLVQGSIPGVIEIDAMAVAPSGHFHVGGRDTSAEPGDPGFYHRVWRYAPDGALLGVYGSESPGDPEGFCNISDMANCNGDICTYDFNCWGIKRWTVDGQFVEEIDTGPLRNSAELVETSMAIDTAQDYIYLAGVRDAGGRFVIRLAR